MIRKAMVVLGAAGALLLGTAGAAGANSDTAAAASTKVAPAPAAQASPSSNTAYSQITDFFCGRINGTPYVGAQSRQAKYTTNTYYMSQTHILQRYNGYSWVSLNSHKFYVNYPNGGVWYYAPNANQDWDWNLTNAFGRFRVKVAFLWKTTSGTTYHAASATPSCIH